MPRLDQVIIDRLHSVFPIVLRLQKVRMSELDQSCILLAAEAEHDGLLRALSRIKVKVSCHTITVQAEAAGIVASGLISATPTDNELQNFARSFIASHALSALETFGATVTEVGEPPEEGLHGLPPDEDASALN